MPIGNYGSPTASVYLVARDLPLVGQARATDAPACWTWAHPGAEENAAMLEDVEREVGTPATAPLEQPVTGAALVTG